MKFRMVWVGSDDDPDGMNAISERPEKLAIRSTVKGTYQIRAGEMVRRELRADGRVKVISIANFTARIVRDVVSDDDTESSRRFVVEAESGGHRVSFVITAAEFCRTRWIIEKLGPGAICYPGQQQHVRAAIQSFSDTVQKGYVFTRPGWRRHREDWVFVHAGGAIGPAGDCADATVQFADSLQLYRLNSSADSIEMRAAVRSSLRLGSAAPERVSWPLLAAVFRAPFGKSDFSLFLAGPSGVFKTAFAALCQQHFGAEMDAGSLPGHFGSTANALEEMAFMARDCLVVVDDFVPEADGGTGVQTIAERLFRAIGNRQGRGRIGGDGRLRQSRPPEALLLATGEAVPRGRSLRARMLIVGVRSGDIDRSVLSECQNAAGRGQLATSMGSFLRWMAGRYEELSRSREERARKLRDDFSAEGVHPRVPAAVAELVSAWELWLRFALDSDAITLEEHASFAARNDVAARKLIAAQRTYYTDGEPALRFVASLQHALTAGCAHIADGNNKAPETPSVWGWRRSGPGWIPCGARIGWIRGDDVYLDSRSAFEVARAVVDPERFEITEQTMRRRLHERGLLASIDIRRKTLLVRRQVGNSARRVLHLKTKALLTA